MVTIQNILGDQESFNTLGRCNKNCYQLFFSNVKKHFNKFPNAKVREILNPIVSNDLVKIGYPDKNKNLLLGQVVRTYDDKVAGIVINTITHDIDFDGNSLNFDKVIVSIYYIFIEYSLRRLFSDKIRKDAALLQKLCHYFEYILVKNLKLFELYKDKRTLFNFVVKVFFYTYHANYNINIAYELALVGEDQNLIKTAIPLSKLAQYKNKTINIIYDVLYDLNILSITPNNSKYMLTNSIGIFSYINIHSNLSSLTASIISSKYKHPNFDSLFISTDMIDEIESAVINNYLVNVDFDTSTFNKIFDKEEQKPSVSDKESQIKMVV